MAVDSKGDLYVADQKVGAIFIFNTETHDTTLIRNGFEAHLGLINGIAIDDDDRIFVTDGKMRRVLIFNSKHAVTDQIDKDLSIRSVSRLIKRIASSTLPTRSRTRYSSMMLIRLRLSAPSARAASGTR